MNRRGFLQSLGTLVGGVLLDKAIPFNRVWSFPSKIVLYDQVFYVNHSPTFPTYTFDTKLPWELTMDTF